MKHIYLSPKDFCAATSACRDGRLFANLYATMAEAWEACPCSDWLIWVLRAVEAPTNERAFRLFAVWCARNTPMHDGRTTGALLTDPRIVAALEVAERFAHGNATAEELDEAHSAAWAAAQAAAWDEARDAAHAASYASAKAAAWGDAAWAAARAAARAAAWAAARAEAGDEAGHAAEAAQAGDSAGAAARTATWTAAWTAARTAAGAAQANQFRTMIHNPFI